MRIDTIDAVQAVATTLRTPDERVQVTHSTITDQSAIFRCSVSTEVDIICKFQSIPDVDRRNQVRKTLLSVAASRLPSPHVRSVEEHSKSGYLVSISDYVESDDRTINHNPAAALHTLIELHSRTARIANTGSYSKLLLEARNLMTSQTQPIIKKCILVVESAWHEYAFELNWSGARWTHGDAKPANVILQGDRLLFVDWDKAGTLSPSADLALAIFTRYTPSDHVSFSDFLDYRGDSDSHTVREMLQILPAAYLVHDAFRSRENDFRLHYFATWSLPKCLPWIEGLP